MTPLLQRMIEDMQLRGLSSLTQRAYLRAVRELARYYDKPPEQITEEELRQYFVYLHNRKHVSRSTATVILIRKLAISQSCSRLCAAFLRLSPVA